jgi:predicted permease
MDPVVLTFAMAISLLSGFAFGLMPAVRRGGPKLAAALRGSGRGASHGRERRRARHTLAVAQVTLATVLLVASGLMVRSFVALTRVQPGFEDAARVQIVRITIPEVQVPDPERVLRMQIDMRDRFAALPGVAAASFANSAPMQGNNSHHILLVEHQPTPDGQLPAVRRFKFIAPGFFETLRTPLIAGRDVDWSDIHGNRPVVIVSENLARELWADPAAALGKRIRDADTSPWREVIGVVANVHDDGVDEPAPALVYWPVLMESFRSNPVQVTRAVTFVVRSERAGAESLIAEMRDAVRAVTGGLPFAQVSTLGELLSRSLVRTSFALVMLAIAATMALLLAVIGLYGVLSYAVSQRIREIGIRSALGASNAALRAMFVRDGLVLAAVGIALGLVAAGALTRVMTSLLFGVSALDPITFVAVAVVLAAAALLASYLPAHRATAVDPAEVLRSS